MAVQPKQTKVLRIGLIQAGKIVNELLVRPGDSVTIGNSSRNALVLDNSILSVPEFLLFEFTAKGYRLHFTEEMQGKISSRGVVTSLETLWGSTEVERSGEGWSLDLTEEDRGKVGMGDIIVLFQFVASPQAQPARSTQVFDFRPNLFDEDDTLFLSWLAFCTALAAVMLIWIGNTELPEYELEELPDRFTEIVMAVTPPPAVELEEEVDGEIIDLEAEAEEEMAEVAEEPKTEVEEAVAKEELKQEVIESSKLLLKMIGTTGETGSGVVDSLWGDGEAGFADLGSALKEGAPGFTTDSTQALRSGEAGKGEAADIGAIKGVGGGRANLDGGPAVQVKAEISLGEASLAEVEDQDAVKQTVQRYYGQLKYCYEQRLKSVPSLEGRVEIAWSVYDTQVEGVYVVANFTGDSELAECMMRKVRRWKFPETVEGELSWPFVFRAKR